MESSDSNSMVHVSDLVIDAPGFTFADSLTVTEEERRGETSLESECCRVKAFFETSKEACVSQGCRHNGGGQSSDLQVAEVDTTSHHVKYRPEVEDITNDSVDLYADLDKKEHCTADKEMTLSQSNDNPDAVTHEIFDDNAMDLSLVEDTSTLVAHKYPSSFAINLKPAPDISSKLSPTCKHSSPVVEKGNQSSDCNFLSPVKPTTSKSHTHCSASSSHRLQSARKIVPMSSPLKSPGWHDSLRSPVRSPKVRRLIRQKMMRDTAKVEIINSRGESVSDSEVEDVNESSRLLALDLYTDVLEDSVQLKYQEEIKKLQEQLTECRKNLEEMNMTSDALRKQLELKEEECEKMEAENKVLRMNISRLMKTAHQEMKSKHREILALELRLKNGGNEELLRRVIPYQPYTGKGISTSNDGAVQAKNIHSKRWSNVDADGNRTKRRRMSENLKEVALTVMKEVKDVIHGREENASVTASRGGSDNHRESTLNEREVSYERNSKFTNRDTVEQKDEGRYFEDEKEGRQRRRNSRSSSCEKFPRRKKSLSYDKGSRSHDRLSKSNKEKGQKMHKDERNYGHDKRRRKWRRLSRSSSREDSSRERDSATSVKKRKSHEYSTNSSKEGRRHKHEDEGKYEHENRDRGRRSISRSSSCEKLLRDRQLASPDHPSNLAEGEVQDKHEREREECKRSDGRRRRNSRSTSCEQSRERERTSHGKDSQSHKHPSKSDRRDNYGKEVSRENERSELRRRYSRSTSCEKSSRERDQASQEKDRKSKREEKRGDSREGYQERIKRDGEGRSSQSSFFEKSSRERESKFCEKETFSDDNHSKSSKKDKDEDEKEQTDDCQRKEQQKESQSSSSRCQDKVSHERNGESCHEQNMSEQFSSKSRKKEERGKYRESRRNEYKRKQRDEKRSSRSTSVENSSRDKRSEAYKEERTERDSKSQKEEARYARIGKSERRRESRYSRSNSHEGKSVSCDKGAKSSYDLKESDRSSRGRDEYYEDEKREKARESKNSRSSSCERSARLRASGSHDRDSDDNSTWSKSCEYSSQAKKQDGDQLPKRSLEAQRRSRSGSHERRKQVHDKDPKSPDSYSEAHSEATRKAKKTEKSKMRKHKNFMSGKKNMRLKDGEKESYDKDEETDDSRNKKNINEDYEKKESSLEERRWSPDEVQEPSRGNKKSGFRESRKKDEYRDENNLEKDKEVRAKPLSPERPFKEQEVRPTDAESDDVVVESGNHVHGVLRHRRTSRSDEREKYSETMRKESRSREWSEESSAEETEKHFNKRESGRRIYSSKENSSDRSPQSSDKKRRKSGKRLDRNPESHEGEDSDDMDKIGGLGRKNNNERNLRSDRDENNENDFEMRSSSESEYEIETEEFELVKSDREETRKKSESMDDAGKTGREMEKLKPEETETELQDKENSDGKNEQEKDKDKKLRSSSKEGLKRKRDENTIERESDCSAKTHDDTSVTRYSRRKCEHYEHWSKDLEWKDSTSESLLEKKTDVNERHSESIIEEELDDDGKKEWKKNIKETKVHSGIEERSETVKEKGNAVPRSSGDFVKPHDREDSDHDLEHESGFTEENYNQDDDSKKPFKRKKVHSPPERPFQGTNIATDVVTQTLEVKKQSNPMSGESMPGMEKESLELKENEISSQSNVQSEKDSSLDASSTRLVVGKVEEKKRHNLEILKDRDCEERVSDEERNNSEEHTGSEVTRSENVKPGSEIKTTLGVKEHPVLTNTRNKSPCNPRLFSDLQMSSNTGDDDESQVQIFDELSLSCDGQILGGSDEEHKELSDNKRCQELSSFPDKLQNDDMGEPCKEQVDEGGNVNVQKENSVTPFSKETALSSQEGELKSVDHTSVQNTDKDESEDEGDGANEFSVKDRTFDDSLGENNTTEYESKCKKKIENGTTWSVSLNEGGMSNASSEEKAGKEVTLLTSQETASVKDGDGFGEEEEDKGENETSLTKEPYQQGDGKVSVTTDFQVNETEGILLDVSCSSKKSDSVLEDLAPIQGGDSSQNGKNVSDKENVNAENTLCTPAKGPFTFEQGHTVISCGKPFTKVVGSIPEEEAGKKECGIVPEEDAIDVYISDCSLMDPFSPDKCRKDLFKEEVDEREEFNQEKVKRKLSSVVVSSRCVKTSKSSTSTSKTKLEDQDDLRKRITPRSPGQERRQRRKLVKNVSKLSPERRRHSVDVKYLNLKSDRSNSASRRKHHPGSSPEDSFDPLRDHPQNRWERRKAERYRHHLVDKVREEHKENDEKGVSKQRTGLNSEEVNENLNGNRERKSSTMEGRETHSDRKREKHESDMEKKGKEADSSLSEGEILSDDENNKGENLAKKSRTQTKINASRDRNDKRTRKSSRRTSSRRTGSRR